MDINKSVYKFFSDYILKHSGILYVESDYYRLDARLEKIRKELDCETYEELCKKFQGKVDSKEHTLLIDLATNNETYFFRDQKPFETLFDVVIPEILERKMLRSINLWSAGCSSGQEPYSICMKYLDRKEKLKLDKFRVDASDISSKVIEKAKEGSYSSIEVKRGLQEIELTKYFDSSNSNNEWKVKEEIKRLINFFSFNLIESIFPINRYDVIFCRNVLIYQTKENREKVLNNLVKSLSSGGFLFMGGGESLIGLDVPLEQVKRGNSIVFVKK